MPVPRIAVIAGDGIGPEVVEAAKLPIDAAVRATGGDGLVWIDFPWGADYFHNHGRMMPLDAIDQLRAFDAIFLGAVGRPDLPDHVTLNGLLLPIRRAFDQYINRRPSYLFKGVASPLVGRGPGSIDLVVYRENTEGEYADVGGRLYVETPHEVAVQSAVFTRRGTERIIRAAFTEAMTRRKHVTSITKSNAQGHSMVFWDDVFKSVSKEFPEIETRSILVDAAAMEMVRRPDRYDVVVASNLFGDILTDLAAAVTGSIGLAASANLNPERTAPSMFEPVHGSAPDIVGQGIANPLATILAGVMMLEHLGLSDGAKRLQAAVEAVLAASEPRTPDLGGKASTAAVSRAVTENVAAA